MKRFGEEVVSNTPIGRSARMRDATVTGQTILELGEAQAQGQRAPDLGEGAVEAAPTGSPHGQQRPAFEEKAV
jgi:hypothetical protein